MVCPFIIELDAARPIQRSHLRTISYLSAICINANDVSITTSQTFIRENCDLIDVYCDCGSLSSTSEIVSLLDVGCKKAFVTESLFQSLLEDGVAQEHASRLILDLDSNHTIDSVSSTQGIVGLDIAQDLRDLSFCLVSPSLQDIPRNKVAPNRLYFKVSDREVADVATFMKEGCSAVLPSKFLGTLEGQAQLDLPLSDAFLSVLQSDRMDGLFPTIVTDERGLSLGMVYSNGDSLRKAVQLGQGVYYSRSRQRLWIKGEESGNTQELLRISVDCDYDALEFKVRQKGQGFCHLAQRSCFGPAHGIAQLEDTLRARKESAPAGSYTARLFNDTHLLHAKVLEEANELCEATSPAEVSAEAADVMYFALTKCIAAGVSFSDVERDLDRKSLKVTRRKGDAKPVWANKASQDRTGGKGNVSREDGVSSLPQNSNGVPGKRTLEEAQSVPKGRHDPAGFMNEKISMRKIHAEDESQDSIAQALQRPSQRATDDIMKIVKPIIEDVRANGDAALLKYTHRFEKASSLASTCLKAPFSDALMQLPKETIDAIDTSFDNIRRFHAAQADGKTLRVETMPGVVCSRFSRPIERVGLYVPGGTATLPSTAMMLGVPAMVAGCHKIIMASPPRPDGSVTPEIVYIANKVGAESIVLAGGAQAIGALAYGTASVSKVDKILGPGNQFVTAAKMMVSNDTTAGVSIDMPAGPSEVLVVADKTADPAFVASDLLSQAEHGTDSQVVLIAIDLDDDAMEAIEREVHEQANALPRVDIVRGAIEHSVTLVVNTIEEAMLYSNQYAPEHLILQVENAHEVVPLVQNAGSVFVGPWTPESVGDYSGGTNHSLPTYGYAKQYSGVNLSSFTKHITCSELTQKGLRNISGPVMELARVEKLEAHRRAVSVRLQRP